METTSAETQQLVEQTYSYAANLLVNQKMTTEETIQALTQQGLEHEAASVIVDTLQLQIERAKKERANKDMLYGALWCIGGIAATAADIGFIFWGAIVFGAIQFFKGAANA